MKEKDLSDKLQTEVNACLLNIRDYVFEHNGKNYCSILSENDGDLCVCFNPEHFIMLVDSSLIYFTCFKRRDYREC